MNAHARMLAQRRQQLVALSRAQRADLADQIQSLNHSAIAMGIGLRILDRVRRHPEWLLGLAFALAAIKPRRLSSALRLGAEGLRTWRNVMPMLQNALLRRE
ncbi:YqjK family protein [Noviherbaspirillum massiliense]|uniref:YqjK family protein n=1 Tax=Noviherbaspirillum massiliense TaxID=1465823 RepID=UPI0002ED3CDB|nr:YqjK family protein [Noviherbaspirillum massiliense]